MALLFFLKDESKKLKVSSASIFASRVKKQDNIPELQRRQDYRANSEIIFLISPFLLIKDHNIIFIEKYGK